MHQHKPLVLHFDVNKTLILTDSMDSKTMDICIREAISDLFWGQSSDNDEKWEWLGPGTVMSKRPPTAPKDSLTYHDYCKRIIPEKDQRKHVVRGFGKADPEAQRAMEKLVLQASAMMELPEELKTHIGMDKAGLNKDRYLMLPAIFKLIATLVRRQVRFALLFRSFGQDHEKIRTEWNAFCERRHPTFEKLLEGIGALDGTVPGVPDKRLDRIHTMFRDQSGPLLALDTFTNGPEEKSWDSWVKTKPKPEADTRNGREFLQQKGAACVTGMAEVRKFFQQQVEDEATAAVKDDWAWWQWQKEADDAGKLLVALDNADVLFFDDNIEHSRPHIVDCRESDGSSMSPDRVKEVCVKVNPVEALLNEDHFIEEVGARFGWSDLAMDVEEPVARYASKEMPTADHGAAQQNDDDTSWSVSIVNFFVCCTSRQVRS